MLKLIYIVIDYPENLNILTMKFRFFLFFALLTVEFSGLNAQVSRLENLASGSYSSIFSGRGNRATGDESFIGSGYKNTAESIP